MAVTSLRDREPVDRPRGLVDRREQIAEHAVRQLDAILSGVHAHAPAEAAPGQGRLRLHLRGRRALAALESVDRDVSGHRSPPMAWFYAPRAVAPSGLSPYLGPARRSWDARPRAR